MAYMAYASVPDRQWPIRMGTDGMQEALRQ